MFRTLALLSCTAATLAMPALGAPIVGFTPQDSQTERALEARFDQNLSAQAIRERLKLMSSAPNQVGSPHDRENAEYVLAQFKQWGWDAHIETFSVLYPTPKRESLELVTPNRFQATLTEPALPGDETSGHQEGGLPAWFAYGGEGDVTAPLVYVNYGMPADYEALRRLGVDVKGKIVIARYGAGWRGLKPKLAYEHGAVGCIVYSDPADDGYATAEPWPKGPARPERGFQRGSIQDLPVEPGDPLTPGYGSTEGAKRIDRADAKNILKIPALPISWGDAQVFLKALGGPVAPRSFRGALPITYHVGGGQGASAHLVVFANWDQKPLYDVIATLKGDREPDQWVIRGNHRDGWVFGAQDPLSGETALLEEAKSMGDLYKGGWRPARTIIYASWDGEEPGLLGSTEWAETHAEDLQKHAILYVNSDTNDRGWLQVEASYSLRSLIDGAAGDVKDPETGASVRDRAMAKLEVDAQAPGASPQVKAFAKMAESGVEPVGNLGSGSDYTTFLDHLGVASMNLGFGGEGQSGGVYHSAYDSFDHFDRFGDPGYHYEVALAEVTGRIVMRAADSDLAPLRFTNLAETVADEVKELKTLADHERDADAAHDRLLKSDAYRLASDPTTSWGDPEAKPAYHAVDFSPLEQAVAKLQASAAAYDAAAAAPPSPAAAKRADSLVQGVEHSLIDEQHGLPGRPWYRHLIYAPGLLTGYGSKTLPGVREAIEGRRWEEAQVFVGRTAEALDAAAARIDQARAALRG